MPQTEYNGIPLRDHVRLTHPELADHALTAANAIAANAKTPLRADARRNRELIIASARELFALRGGKAHHERRSFCSSPPAQRGGCRLCCPRNSGLSA